MQTFNGFQVSLTSYVALMKVWFKFKRELQFLQLPTQLIYPIDLAYCLQSVAKLVNYSCGLQIEQPFNYSICTYFSLGLCCISLSAHSAEHCSYAMCAQISKKKCNHTHTQNTTKATRNQWIIQHLNKHKTRLDFGKGKNMECGKGWGGITTASTCIEIHKIKLRRSHNDEQNKVAQNFREHSTMECQEGKRKEEGGRRKEGGECSRENERKETIAGEVK